MKPDFIARTLAMAKKNATKENSKEFMEKVASIIGTPYEDMVNPYKEKVRQLVSTELGLDIISITKYPNESKDPEYHMETKTGRGIIKSL